MAIVRTVFEESGLSLLSILAGVPCYVLWKRGPRLAGLMGPADER